MKLLSEICKMILNFSFLVFVIAFGNGEVVQQSAYDFFQICHDTVYGIGLENIHGTENLALCGKECNERADCSSFTFDGINKTCRLVNGTYSVNPVNCTAFITYGLRQILPNSRCGLGYSCTLPVNNVRLCDGGGPGICLDNTGRVEVYHGGEWGTVCDDYWNDGDYGYDYTLYEYGFRAYNAEVVCRMFGYSSGISKPEGQAVSGADTSMVWMDGVVCTGSESHLFDCRFQGFGQENCNHFEDVGVECFD